MAEEKHQQNQVKNPHKLIGNVEELKIMEYVMNRSAQNAIISQLNFVNKVQLKCG